MAVLRSSIPPLGASAALLLSTSLGGCVGHGPAVVGPVPDAEQMARALQRDTRLDHASRIVFQWQLNESGVRIHGRGVARVEDPYHARLDLFLTNGETVVRAALVGSDLRLPPGAPRDILPPPDLMWGVLGVFRPESGTRLLGADRLDGGGTRLRYRYANGEELHFQLEDGRVKTAEVLDDSHTTQRLQLSLSPDSRFPTEATYRDLTAFRELKLVRESVEQVGPFPPGIWNLVR